MKKLSEDQVDDLFKLKFGKIVQETGHRAYISNKVLGKIFKLSEGQVAHHIRVRFQRNRLKSQTLM